MTHPADSSAVEVVRLREALEAYADPRNWGISRDDLNHRVVAWIGPGATEPIPDAPGIARAALARDPSQDRETAGQSFADADRAASLVHDFIHGLNGVTKEQASDAIWVIHAALRPLIPDALLTSIENRSTPAAVRDPAPPPASDRPPDSFWREVPCGHPPDPVAWISGDENAVCHCGHLLDDAVQVGSTDSGDGIRACNKCGCYVAVPAPPQETP